MPKVTEPTFAKGEISPQLYGRVDTAAYQTGLRRATNAIVHTYGAVSRRPGTKFIGPVKNHSKAAPRLIKFQFNIDDNYILEFGDRYMRVIRNDGHVITNSTAITDISQTDPIVVTAPGHPFNDFTEVFLSGMTGATELVGNRYLARSITTDTFELTRQDNPNLGIDGSLIAQYIGGGFASEIFEIDTPYDIEDVPALNVVQTADVMTIVHPSYAVKELRRFANDDWTLTDISVQPNISAPGLVAAANNGASGSETERWIVTAVSRDTGEESLAGTADNQKFIDAITNESPGEVTTNIAHDLVSGEEIILRDMDISGMPSLDQQRFIVEVVDSTTFNLLTIDGEDFDTTEVGTYTNTGGRLVPTFKKLTNAADPLDVTVSWNAVTGAERYNVYRRVNGIFGLVGQSQTTEFEDNNITPNVSLSPPSYRFPFTGTDAFPGAVGNFEQRRVFGGTNLKPDTSEFTQPGAASNFNTSIPSQATDAIQVTLTSDEVNQIRHYVPLNDLLVLTSGSEWRIFTGDNTGFDGESIRQRPQSNWGTSLLQPIILGNTCLFVTPDLANVRSLNYSLELDAFTGDNINILSRHLLDGHSIVDWGFTRSPESRIYMCRDDGDLVTLSYDRQQELIAWTTWETQGKFQSCEGLRGGGQFDEDSVYFVTNRIIDFRDVKLIEVARDEYFDDARDCFFLDCGLTFDNPVSITDVSETNPVIVTAPSHGLVNGDEVDIDDIEWKTSRNDLGEVVIPDQLNGKSFVVSNVTADTFEIQVDGRSFKAYQTGGVVRDKVQTLFGLFHLNETEVEVLADGNVITGLEVDNVGTLRLPRKAARIHVGLPYTTDIETLDIEDAQTVQGNQKKVNNVVIQFFKSRGLLVGPTTSQLVEIKQRENELYDQNIQLFSDEKQINLESTWNTNGRIALRQKDPLPMTILSITPEFELSEN